MYLVKLNYLIAEKLVTRTIYEFFGTLSRAKANATIEAYKNLQIKSASVFYMRPDGTTKLVACRIYVDFLCAKARNWFVPEEFIEEPEERIDDEEMKESLREAFQEFGRKMRLITHDF